MTAIEKVLLAEVDSFTSRGRDYFKSNDRIAADLGVSASTVKRAIATLQKLGMLERTAFDGRRRGLKSTADQTDPTARPERADSQTRTTTQPDQNDPAGRPERPPRNTIQTNSKKSKKKRVIMPFPEFEETWTAWKEYKKTEHRFTFKSTDTEQAALHHLAKIANQNATTATTIIHTSIANGWKGLFPARTTDRPEPTTADRDKFEAYIRTGQISNDAE